GKVTAAIFGQPEPWIRTVRDTALAAGDRCWPMPLYEEYAEQLKSDIADMMNTGGRPAGACTAAMFLKEFVGTTPWAHLDVAGVLGGLFGGLLIGLKLLRRRLNIEAPESDIIRLMASDQGQTTPANESPVA